jgi:hypothetical protein
MIEGLCYICFESGRLGDPLVRHREETEVIHEKCLNTWLKLNPTCPLCREPMVVWKNKIKIWTVNASVVAITTVATHFIASSIQKVTNFSSLLPMPIGCAMTALGTVGEMSAMPLLREFPIIMGAWHTLTNYAGAHFGWAATYSAAVLGWGTSALLPKVELINLKAIRYGMATAALASIASWATPCHSYLAPMLSGALMAGNYAAGIFSD